MKKNTYRIKETKEGYYEFTYSGSLECVLEKLRRDLEKEEKIRISYIGNGSEKGHRAIFRHMREKF